MVMWKNIRKTWPYWIIGVPGLIVTTLYFISLVRKESLARVFLVILKQKYAVEYLCVGILPTTFALIALYIFLHWPVTHPVWSKIKAGIISVVIYGALLGGATLMGPLFDIYPDTDMVYGVFGFFMGALLVGLELALGFSHVSKNIESPWLRKTLGSNVGLAMTVFLVWLIYGFIYLVYLHYLYVLY